LPLTSSRRGCPPSPRPLPLVHRLKRSEQLRLSQRCTISLMTCSFDPNGRESSVWVAALAGGGSMRWFHGCRSNRRVCRGHRLDADASLATVGRNLLAPRGDTKVVTVESRR